MNNLRIGVLGGSFNPPHAGHRQISLQGMRLMRLDFVIWLVTPGNPQKNSRDYADLTTRMAAAQACAAHPRILISDFESRNGLTYTAETLDMLTSKYASTRFVWMMGADNLNSFHTWRDWQRIAATMPIAVFNRPGNRIAPLTSPAGHALARFRVPVARAATLPDCEAPAWTYFPGTLNRESSTRLRQTQPDWAQTAEKA
ncbi:nicotinate-nucleotide adenylyltransferase [Aquisalinus luteolus]|uniref:nicotinate-nucleotide adenylyltransferase n=1 Tax=Aquisalinus luteolus TaxID=1566827 RepID=UPI00197D9115|nr:nicotinate-nucleotide adenylyltransferase [Aquisalinus luteolus]